jgi:hypothetical protein
MVVLLPAIAASLKWFVPVCALLIIRKLRIDPENPLFPYNQIKVDLRPYLKVFKKLLRNQNANEMGGDLNEHNCEVFCGS